MKRFVLVSSKGGVGKSTVSCALASTMARHGLTAVLCDGDSQGSITDWFDMGERRGLAELIEGTFHPMFSTIRVAGHLRVLPTGDRDLLARWSMRTVGEVPPYFRRVPGDTMIIDTAAHSNALTGAFLRRLMPDVIVPVSLAGGYLPLAALEQTIAALAKVGREPDYILPNMLDRRTSVSERTLRKLQREYGDLVLPSVRINANLVHTAWSHRPPTDPKTVEDLGRVAEILYARWDA